MHQSRQRGYIMNLIVIQTKLSYIRSIFQTGQVENPAILYIKIIQVQHIRFGWIGDAQFVLHSGLEVLIGKINRIRRNDGG
ncbi:MAG: hypothetical protein BWY71_00887 [Planctomycetes bacterium ADurb.Bin412]|nr:MAG: hypothetical protein BWY71_00887 [Planctomycetes bacterium ADurb.Bin412]